MSPWSPPIPKNPSLHEKEAYISFSPGMRSGSPTISGTRLTMITVLHGIWTGGVRYTMEGWEVNREQCLVAAWFAGIYGIAEQPYASGRHRPSRWQQRFGPWAREHASAMWAGRFNEVPDPPSMMDEDEQEES